MKNEDFVLIHLKYPIACSRCLEHVKNKSIILDFKEQIVDSGLDQHNKHERMKLIHNLRKWFLSQKKKKFLQDYLNIEKI